MRRRDFIKLLGASAAGWSLSAHAQQLAPTRRIGALMNIVEYDQQARVWASAFESSLQELGWKVGGNLQIDYRWANNDILYRRFAHELVELAPQAILAVSGSSATALQEATRTIPVVFMATSDPVNRGLVASMEKPGGNFTGFIEFEPSIGEKWLEVLRHIAPGVTRVVVVRDPTRLSSRNLITAIEKAAPLLGVEVTPADARNSAEVERLITTVASNPNGGLIVTPNAFSAISRDRIVALAARHKLPAVYFSRFFVTEGGLSSYAPDAIDEYRRAAGYIDRILKGEKPGDMAVRSPAKFEFVINLRTAQVIGLPIPASAIAVADAVIK
jgi:putative ABC transport system substrate-binding protein